MDRFWRRFHAHAAAGDKFLFLLDFDGTLSSFVRQPGLARLSPGLRDMLMRLAKQPRAIVAVVSGRALDDVRRRVNLKGLYYAGNHGLEIRGPGLSFTHQEAKALRPALMLLARRLRRALVSYKGARVENKGLSLSVHFRNVAVERRTALSQILKTSPAARGPVRWRRGHLVWEALPLVDWHKGKAAMWLLKRLGPAVPIALGDDTTDEDMFRAARLTGLAVRVGIKKSSNARAALKNQNKVPRFINAMLEVLYETSQ